MEYTGTITFIGEVETVGKDDLPKQTIVIQEVTDRDHPWSVTFDLWKDKIELVKGLSLGDEVTVWLNVKAREYNGRWFNSVSAWKLTNHNAKDTWPKESLLPF